MLHLFLLLSFPLFLPLCKLPLPYPAPQKHLYLREQDTGQGLRLIAPGSLCRSRRVASPVPGIPLFKQSRAEQATTESRPVSGSEAAHVPICRSLLGKLPSPVLFFSAKYVIMIT